MKSDQTGRKASAFLPVFILVFTLTVTLGIGGLFVYKWIITGSAGEETYFTQIPDEERDASKYVKKTDAEVPVTGGKDIGDNSDGDTLQAATEAAENSDTENADTSETSSDEAPGEWEHPSSDDHTRFLESENPETVIMAFAGDILFDPGYAIMGRIRKNGGTLNGIVGESLTNRLKSADIAVINNEFSYSDRGTPTEGKTFTFRAKPESAELLTELGIDLATFANNHSYDYGPEALTDSLDAVRSYDIAAAGAGYNIDDASRPVTFINQAGLQIAVFSATQIERLEPPDTKAATADSPGVFRCLDDTRLLKRIREAKDEGCIVVVCIHWGTENETAIDYWQKKQAPEIIEAGADLIIGCHPHILQAVEYIDGIPVVYSLGNFLFNSRTLDSCMVTAEITRTGVSELKFYPAIQTDCTVVEATGAEKNRIIDAMNGLSKTAVISDDCRVTQR